VCDSPGGLARSRRVACLYLALYCCDGCSFGSFSVGLSRVGMIPACSFYSLKEVQSYKMLACGVTISRGLGRALSGGSVVCTVEA
jgi:hypothetical protein